MAEWLVVYPALIMDVLITIFMFYVYLPGNNKYLIFIWLMVPWDYTEDIAIHLNLHLQGKKIDEKFQFWFCVMVWIVGVGIGVEDK